MKFLNLFLALTLTMISIEGLANSPFVPYEAFFFGKTYVKDEIRLTFHAAQSQKEIGFRICNLVNPSVVITECVWEFYNDQKAVIVWVNGNRDWWTVERAGRVLADGDFKMQLVTAPAGF